MKKSTIFVSMLFFTKSIFSFAQWEGENYKPVKVIEKQKVSLSNLKEQKTQDLLERLKKLKNGEKLVIPNGEYKDLGIIKIKQNNIKISAENPGQVIFSGKVQILISGDCNVFSDFIFVKGGPANSSGIICLLGNENKIVNNSFINFNIHDEKESDWITLKGSKNKILNNYFEGKTKRGQIIVINKNLKKQDKHIIAQNIFKNHKSEDSILKNEANGWEAIRTGTGKTALHRNSEIEILYNLFINMDAEPELISVKSSNTLLKGNTVISSIAGITLRQGRDNVVEDNVILGMEKEGTRGIRFYDKGHVIRNNYIEGLRGKGNATGGLVSATGVIDTKNGEESQNKIISQWTPNNILIENNSFINSEQNILYSDKIHSPNKRDNLVVEKVYPGYNLYFKNNLSYEENPNNYALIGAEDMNPLDSEYENEVYFGKIKGVLNLPKGIDRNKPFLKRKQGILIEENKNIGAKNLLILTENIIGPNYKIEN